MDLDDQALLDLAAQSIMQGFILRGEKPEVFQTPEEHAKELGHASYIYAKGLMKARSWHTKQS